MRSLLFAVPLCIGSATSAQVQTRCVRQDYRTVDCETTAPSPTLDSYATALSTSQQLVPETRSQDFAEQQIQNLRLRNQMMRRQLELQAAPGYDHKQCRRSAKAAIDASDLTLARDILASCAGQR